METPWNLCAQQPIVLSKSPNRIQNDGQMTPLMLDALNSSPNSIDNDCNGRQFVIPQRRASGSYETSYLNNHQYSVQGSTSTPNSIGPSSGTASPDGSTQFTSDSSINFTHTTDSTKWIEAPTNYDKTPRYCYVFHSQPQSGAITMMSDSTSIISNSSAHSTITVPSTPIMSQTFTNPIQTFVTVGSPYQTNSLPVPPTSKQSIIERSSSVPPQNITSNKTTDFSSLNDQKAKKPKKRKASVVVELGQPAKKQVVTKEINRSTTKSTISALTRRRLKTAEKSGEPLEKMHLLLTELTVEDLKIICRKYNLAISGTKSDLLRRLNPIESKIDVEAILLDAMQEEDQRQSEENPSENAKMEQKSLPIMNQIPTVKIPVNTCNGTNQFDMAISNYLLQHRKQINQTSTKDGKPVENDCSCAHPTTLQAKNANFSTTKTIYFTPSTIMNGQGPKTTVIRVPIGNFNPPMDTSNGPPPANLPKKVCKFDTFQCNGPATFSYAEMGSGGQFTLETTPVKNTDSTSSMPKFLQISVPSTFCTSVKDPQQTPIPACLKCKDRVNSEENGSDELRTLISELSIGQINAVENSTLTARILALHQQTIKAQYSKLYSMGKVIGDSQKILQCQQNKIETARKAMLKIKSSKPSSIDSILQKLDISQLDEQHGRQSNELKTIQQNHQQLKSEQEKVTKSEMELQEDIHVEQAVEDVVRLIKSNRKTALLIVQLVHKFQCDRMRELKNVIKKPENVPKVSNCTECTNENGCNCKVAKKIETPTVVTIDESDDEFNCNRQKIEEVTNEGISQKPIKKKSKGLNKKGIKQVSMAQRSEHTFAEVMEDIFQTVITSEIPINDSSKENLPKDESIVSEGTPEISVEKVQTILNQPTTFSPKVYEPQISQPFTNSNTSNQPITPPIYNYMTPTVPKTEVHSVNQYPQYAAAETRPNNTNYHQRRAFLQQKQQTLYRELEQIERQQLHNEMQNTYISNSIDIDEELANLGDLNVEDLYNYDFDQLDANTPETPASVVPFNNAVCPVQYMPPYQQQFNHSNPGFNPEHQPLIQQQQRTPTFQHVNSNDFEDILDLIRNGEKNRQSSMDFDDGAQATNAIYQELRLTDQFQPFTPMQEIDEMNWNDPLATNEENKQVAVDEN